MSELMTTRDNQFVMEQATIPYVPTFQDTELTELTGRIAVAMVRSQDMYIKAAYYLNKVKTLGKKSAWFGEGKEYKTFIEYAEDLFGWKKTQSYNLCNIADRFFTYTEHDDGTLTYESKIVNAGSWSYTQLDKASRLQADEFNQLVDNAELSPEMTCSEVDKVVTDFVNSKKGKKSKAATDEPEVPKAEMESDIDTYTESKTASGEVMDKKPGTVTEETDYNLRCALVAAWDELGGNYTNFKAWVGRIMSDINKDRKDADKK